MLEVLCFFGLTAELDYSVEGLVSDTTRGIVWS
jgi:hypothetical protein